MKDLKYIYQMSGRMVCMALLLLQMVGCNSDRLGAGEGLLSLELEQNDDVTTKSEGVAYALDIVNIAGDTVVSYPDNRDVVSIKIKEGAYTIHAKDNTEPTESLFARPRYGARKPFVVTAGDNTSVLLTCGLINVKMQVTEFEQAIKDNFTNYSLVIKPTEDYLKKDTLTFTQADVDASQIGWLDQSKEGSFVIIFRATNKQSPDKELIYIQTINEVDSADFYRFKVKMNANVSGDSEGGAMFRLRVETDYKTHEFPFGVTEEPKAIPVVTRDDLSSINDPMTTNVEVRSGNMKVKINAAAGIKRLRIRHDDVATLVPYGLPRNITLGGKDNTHAQDEIMRGEMAGVVAWSAGTVVGATDVWVDFSKLMNEVKLGGELLPKGSYVVELEIYDQDNQMVKQKITLSVASDVVIGGALSDKVVDKIPGLGAEYAYVSAQWLGATKPEGLAFEYRLFLPGTDGAWSKVTVGESYVDDEKKSFVGLLTDLRPQTLYEFRPVWTGLVPGAGAVFMTDVLVDLPNLDFEGGYTKDAANGKSEDVYYPNATGQPEFWATGNEGGKYLVFGQGLDKNVTLPVTGVLAHTGTALYLKSHYVNSLAKSLASGTIFTGKFGPMSGTPTTPDKQRAFVSYGQGYTGRPLALKGWYKYFPKNIDIAITDDGKGINNSKFAALMGTEDNCRIYISLEAWGEGVTRRPENPVVVGSGELKTGSTPSVTDNNGYVPFEFKIDYKSAVKPDHIVMCATSSALSDDFCGGNGSELYIDDFELVWDPSELATP